MSLIPYAVDKEFIVLLDADKQTDWGDGSKVYAIDTGKYYLLYNKAYIQIGGTEAGKGLLLDQTTEQTVENGSPTFDKGITLSAGEKLIFDG